MMITVRRAMLPVAAVAVAALTAAASGIGTATAQEQGELLWSTTFDDFDDFEDGNSGIRQVNPPDTTAAIVADPEDQANRVGQFRIERGGRAEFIPEFRDLREGDELWFGVSTRLSEDYPLDASWQVILQWKNDGTGSPPLSLVAEDGEYRLHGGFGHPSGDRSFTRSLGASSVETWERWVLRVRFSSNPSVGSIDAWRNGEQVLSDVRPRGGTLYPGRTSYLKVGYYRNSSISTPGGVLYDDYRVGTTQDVVR